LHNYLK